MRPSDFVIRQSGDIRWLTFPPLDAFPFILHGLTVRGGNTDSNDVRKETAELLKIVSRPKAKVVSLSQMHRDRCVAITSRDKLRESYSGDAVLTDRDDVLISVSVADCLPIFVVNPKRTIIGLIHAGWRGTLSGIARGIMREAKDRFGCEPGEFTLLFGPSIRSCCYRVSNQVAILFDGDCVNRRRDGAPMLDLVHANLKQFTWCGVKKDKTFVAEACTSCEKELFYSYRRDKENAGRMIGFMALR